MAIKTTEEQLEEVQGAISAVLTGNQSYTLDGRSVSRANLEALQAREAELLRRYAGEQGNRPFLSAVTLNGAGY
jgi:hypothetical protein